MTSDEIEAVWQDVYRMYERSNPNIYPAAIMRLRAPFDLALKAIAVPEERDASALIRAAVKAAHNGEFLDFGTLGRMERFLESHPMNKERS